jgi:hypothetical protein
MFCVTGKVGSKQRDAGWVRPARQATDAFLLGNPNKDLRRELLLACIKPRS